MTISRRTKHGFEHCAARLAGLMDSNINIETVTRPSVDGGRDAIARIVSDHWPTEFRWILRLRQSATRRRTESE